MNRTQMGLAALVALVTSGCMTTPVQRVETLGQGNVQVGIEPGVHGFGSAGFVPGFNVSARYGVSDKVDVGGRIGSSVYEVGFKYMITDPEVEGLGMSLAPQGLFFASGSGGGGAVFGIVRVPYLLGIPVGESQLVIGPTLTNWFLLGGSGEGSAGAYALEGGASVGFNARLSPNFALHPEFGLNRFFFGAAGVSGLGGDSISFGGSRYAFTLGILVGGGGRGG